MKAKQLLVVATLITAVRVPIQPLAEGKSMTPKTALAAAQSQAGELSSLGSARLRWVT